MTTGRSIRLTTVLLPVLAVVSCIYLPIPPVDDLKLVSVDVVAQSDIPRHDKYWSDGEITGPLVRVTFSSSYDFQELARQWSYYVGQTTAFCDSNANDPRNPLEGFPDLDDKFGSIDSYNSQHIDSGSGLSGPILYHVYFDLGPVYKVIDA